LTRFTLDSVSTGGPDLFVVCKNCGSEVSPYITECPYCGTRLRKRAPKIDRNGRIAERTSRRPPAPSLSRLRRGEIPGIRHEAHPYTTLALVLLGVVGCLIWRTSAVDISRLVVNGNPIDQWWRVFTAPFVYDNTGYAFVALGTIAIYGWLLERRYGSVMVIALVLLGGAGGIAVAGRASSSLFLGGNGAALALLCAWVVPDLMRLVSKRDFDGDLIGTGVLAGVLVLMPLAAPHASWVAAGVGAGAGLIFGFLLTRIHHGTA
jgi:membrane associated rhomboid family serine protease